MESVAEVCGRLERFIVAVGLTRLYAVMTVGYDLYRGMSMKTGS